MGILLRKLFDSASSLMPKCGSKVSTIDLSTIDLSTIDLSTLAAGLGAGASDCLREMTSPAGSTGLGARLADTDGAGGLGPRIVVFVGLAGDAAGTFGAAAAESCVE